jgi:hypothetical protein
VPSVDGATSVLFDQALTNPWSLGFSDAPPDDHLERDGGLATAVEIALSYLDLDGSGDLTDGDAPAEAVCLDDRAVAMLYVEPPTELYAAWVLTLQGLGAGWSPLAIGADGSIARSPRRSSWTCRCRGIVRCRVEPRPQRPDQKTPRARHNTVAIGSRA